ncbi:MAG: hypothetical protein ACP5UM_12935, partial [Anaerolineae bacterium]
MARQQEPEGFVWWKHGVVYQIYPRSFADSNDDGIGDLRTLDSHFQPHDLGVDEDVLVANPLEGAEAPIKVRLQF